MVGIFSNNGDLLTKVFKTFKINLIRLVYTKYVGTRTNNTHTISDRLDYLQNCNANQNQNAAALQEPIT